MRESILRIIDGDLTDPRVTGLLETHLAVARAQTPPESVHALDLEGLRSPSISLWTIWEGETLLGTGALKRLDAQHGEIKSMHTLQAERGKGIGSAMLHHIMAVAKARGMTRLSLETGAFADFAAARALYRRHGFLECGPFGDYRDDPNSVFMTRILG